MAFLPYPAAADGTIDKAIEIEELSEFIANARGVYNGGMTQISENHVMRETAKYMGHDFADTSFPVNLTNELKQQENSANSILLCTLQNIDKSSEQKDLAALKDSLQEIKKANKYQKVLLPVGAWGYGVSHMMALCIEGDKAYLFEQFGSNTAYSEVKKAISDALINAGYTVKLNTQPLTDGNRMDCATVSNHIISEAAKANSIEDLYQRLAQKSPSFTHAEIDRQQETDQQFAQMALQDINEGHRDDRNNSADIILLQKLLAKYSLDLEQRRQLAEEFWQAEDKTKFVESYQPTNNDNTMEVSDKPFDGQDGSWKDEVRRAVAKAKETVQTGFAEYDDPEHPERLCFRDGDDKMIFSSRNKVAVEGDMQTFRTLCQTAKNMNMSTINFGQFEEHPEYRARLYLACLESGMKMKNAPKLEELRDYPEFPAIMNIYVPQRRQELADKLKQSRFEFKQASQKTNDPEYKKLKEALNNAIKSKDADAIEAAKEALNANPAAQEIQKTAQAYKSAMKASLNFYIQYGSESSKPEQTPEERRKKVEKHLSEYDAETFFSHEYISKKDREEGKTPAPRTAKKEEIAKYKNAQNIAREIINGGRSSR